MWRDFDKAFFHHYPTKQYLARPFGEGDAPMPSFVMLFGKDETGAISQINTVVVKRIAGGRLRRLFAVAGSLFPRSDQEIIEFLRSREIDPMTMMPSCDNDD